MGRNTDISGVYGVVSVTPSDSADVTGGSVRGFMVGATGDVNVMMADDSTAVLSGLLVGQVYPFQVKRFLSTSTTATGIVGLR